MARLVVAALLSIAGVSAPASAQTTFAPPAPTPESLTLVPVPAPAIPDTREGRTAALAALEAEMAPLFRSHRLPLLKRALSIARVDGPSPTTLDLETQIIELAVEGPVEVEPPRADGTARFDSATRADFSAEQAAIIDAARRVLDDHRGIDWRPDPVTARAITRLARKLIAIGDVADAEILLTRAIVMQRVLAGGAASRDYGEVLRLMGDLCADSPKAKASDVERWLLPAVAQYRGLAQPDLSTARAIEATLASTYERTAGREADARAVRTRLLAEARANGSVAEQLDAFAALASLESRVKNRAAAEALLREAVALPRADQPAFRRRIVALHENLADIYFDDGKLTDERDAMKTVVALQRAFDPDDLTWTRYARRLLGIYDDLRDRPTLIALGREMMAAIPQDPRGQFSPVRLGAIRSLSKALLALDDYDAVLKVTDELTEFRDATGKSLRVNLVQALMNRGRALRSLGRFDEALQQFADVLAIPRKDISDYGASEEQVERLIALTYFSAGKYPDAFAATDRSLAASAAASGSASLRYAQQLSWAGDDLNSFVPPYDIDLNSPRAESLFRRSLAIMDKLADWPEQDYLDALDGLATALAAQGKVADGIAVHEQRIKLMAAKHGKASKEALRAQSSYSEFLSGLDKEEAALDVQRGMFETALAAYGPENDVTLAIGVNSLSLFVEEGPRLEHARYVYETLFGGGRNETADVRMPARVVMAQVEATIGDVDKAKQIMAEIDTKALGTDLSDSPIDLIGFLMNQIDRRNGIYGRNLDVTRRLVERCERLAVRDVECDEQLADYGEELFLAGQFAKALPYAAGGFDLAEREQRRLSLRGVQARRSSSDRNAAKQFDRYGVFLDTLWDAGGDKLDADPAVDPRVFRSVQRITNSDAASAMAVAQTRLATGTGELAKLIQQLQTTADALNEQEDSVLKERMADALALVGDARSDDKQEVLSDRRRPKRSEADVARLRATYAGTDATIRSVYPEYAALLSPTPVELADVQKALGPGEGLLVAAEGDSHLHLMLVTHDRARWQRSRGKLAEIDRLVTVMLCHVDVDKCPAPFIKEVFGTRAEAKYTPFDAAASQKLYADSVGLFGGELEGIDTLFVVAEGQFAQVPVGMLVTTPAADADSESQWLIDRIAPIRLPSVSALLLPRSAKSPAWTREFEGYGDPLLEGRQPPPQSTYAAVRGSNGLQLADVRFLKKLEPLAGSRRELSEVAGLFPAGSTAIHLGAKATEAGVKENAGLAGARIVSFATHGLLPTDVAGIDEPGLVMTPPAEPSPLNDGLLTASEAAQLHLTADMVILSACNTASAQFDRAGDSMSSLSRAFLFAGAGSLLASHWRVADDATVALMAEMLRVRRADAGMTRAKALQQAMLAVRKGRHADGSPIDAWRDYWAHPSSWAAFSLIANRND